MTAPSPDAPGALNWALILILGVIWGAAFMGMSIALEGYGPLSVAAWRTVIAALILAVLGQVIGQGLMRIRGRRAWGYIAVLGLLNAAAPFALLAWAIQHVPSAFAGVAMGAVPLLILPLVAVFSPEEGIGPRRIAGVSLGFVGLVLLVGQGAFDGTGSPAELAGRIACLLAAACYAVASVMTRRAPPMPPIAFAAGTLCAGAAILVPLALTVEGWSSDLSLRPSLALLYVAALPTALAFFIRVRVITTAGSLFMSLTSYMVPVWAVIFGIALMGEDLPPQLYAALGLILGGIALSQSRALTARLRRHRGD